MKQTTIIIEGIPFTYDDEVNDFSYDKLLPISEDDAKMLLETTDKLFKPLGLKYYLSFGTLLGAVRDNSIIKGDEDVDIFIEDEILLMRCLPILQKNNYNLCRRIPGVLYSFRVGKSRCYIDIYIHCKLPMSIWSIWCDSLCAFATPRRLLKEKDTIHFLGGDYGIPANPENLLVFWYGKEWRTPVKGHQFTYDTPSHYWWKTKGKYRWERLKNCIKLPIKFLIGWKYWKKYVKK